MAAVSQAADVIFVTDHRDRFVYLSDAVEALIGVPAADLVGEAALSVVAPKDHSRILDALRVARFGDEKGPQLIETEWTSPTGGNVSVEITVRPAPVAGPERGCICVARDASKTKAHFDQRIASERVAAIVELAKEAAHQINNPLAILTVHLGVLEKAAEQGKPAQPEALEQMRSVITRIAEVTSDLAAAANTSIQKSILGASVADLATEPTDLDL